MKGYIIPLCLLFLYCSCQLFDFGKGVKKDTKRIFSEKKQFIYNASFAGIIKEKRDCNKCDLNKYSLVIKLDSGSTKPSFTDANYSPYYNYENDTVLLISVSKQLFQLANTNDGIKKEPSSSNIIIHDKSCMLLSSQKDIWIP